MVGGALGLPAINVRSGKYPLGGRTRMDWIKDGILEKTDGIIFEELLSSQ